MNVQAVALLDAYTLDCEYIVTDIYNKSDIRMTVAPSSNAYVWPNIP